MTLTDDRRGPRLWTMSGPTGEPETLAQPQEEAVELRGAPHAAAARAARMSTRALAPAYLRCVAGLWPVWAVVWVLHRALWSSWLLGSSGWTVSIGCAWFELCAVAVFLRSVAMSLEAAARSSGFFGVDSAAGTIWGDAADKTPSMRASVNADPEQQLLGGGGSAPEQSERPDDAPTTTMAAEAAEVDVDGMEYRELQALAMRLGRTESGNHQRVPASGKADALRAKLKAELAAVPGAIQFKKGAYAKTVKDEMVVLTVCSDPEGYSAGAVGVVMREEEKDGGRRGRGGQWLNE